MVVIQQSWARGGSDAAIYSLTITVLFIDDHLMENGFARPKHPSYIGMTQAAPDPKFHVLLQLLDALGAGFHGDLLQFVEDRLKALAAIDSNHESAAVCGTCYFAKRTYVGTIPASKRATSPPSSRWMDTSPLAVNPFERPR